MTLASTNPGAKGTSFRSSFALGEPKQLTSFAASSESLKGSEKTRPFGAPESDVEESSSEASDDGTVPVDKEKGRHATPDKIEAKTVMDDRKRLRLQRGELSLFPSESHQPLDFKIFLSNIGDHISCCG